MSDNFQTNLSGSFVPVPDPTKIVLRGKGKRFDDLKRQLESLPVRPDLTVTVIENGVRL